MSKKITLFTCLGLAALAGLLSQVAAETGPVREGARRTGEAVAEGTRAAVRGTGQAIGRAGEAVRDTVNSPADAARAQVNRGDRSELEVRGSEPMLDPTADASVGANVGPAQVQTDAALNQNRQLNTEGQIEGQLNDSSQDNRYQSGFRGPDGQGATFDQQSMSGGFQQGSRVEYNGRLHNVRISRDGRPYICVGGCPVYLDQEQSGGQQHQAYRMSDDQMQQNGIHQGAHYDQEPMQGDQQYQNRQDNLQGRTYQSQEGYAPVPEPPAPPTSQIQSDIDAGSRSLDSNTGINADQSIRAAQDPSRSGSANIDAEAGASALGTQQQQADLNSARDNAEAAADSESNQNENAEADEPDSSDDSTSSDSSNSGT